MPKASRYSGALKPAEFDAAVTRHPRLRPGAVAAARAVLVDGLGLEAAASAQGFSRAHAAAVCRTLYAHAVPDGWVVGYVALPVELMEKVRAMEEKARAGWQPKAKSHEQKGKSK